MNITRERYVYCYNFPLIFVEIVFGPWKRMDHGLNGQLIN